MSSYRNRRPVDAKWFYDINAGGDSRCIQAASEASSVGWRDNDEASSVQIYTDNRAC